MLAGVRVQVAVERDPALLHEAADHELGVPDRGVALAHHGPVLPIQVLARQRAPVVAHYDPVRVQHRHELEYEAVPQLPGLVRVARQEVDYALHYPARGRLPGVHPRRQHHALLAWLLLLRLSVLVAASRGWRRGYGQVVDAVAREATAEQSQLRVARLHRVLRYLGQVVLVFFFFFT